VGRRVSPEPSEHESAVSISVGSQGGVPEASLAGTVARHRIADRYEVLGLLGAGGMGLVYRVRDSELDEVVALKMIHGELASQPGMLARFRQEAKLARRVTHRNVARTFDVGEDGGARYLTMEFVDGESLAGRTASRGPLAPAEAVAILREVCSAMSAAHAAGVVHRDLKPDNVLLGKDGRVVVTDFGIAHALALGPSPSPARTVGGVVGTPAYMAPEQVEGVPDLDGRADIYALGAMAYELLTGALPWPGDTPFAVAAARLMNPPPDPQELVPGLPEALAAVVRRCMAKDRNDRYATAGDVEAALAEALAAPDAPDAAPSRALRATRVAPLDVPAAKTVAVLPFHNGGPPDEAYLADGLTDDLIDALSMTRGLKVRPRGAVAHLRGQDHDPRAVGRDLDVQVVVEGSVRKTPSGVRVSARVIGVADGFQLWAKRFDRPAADVLVLNDEAAHAIAEALTVHFTGKPRVAPTDALAVDLYLRASHEYAKFWRSDVERAVDLYEQALSRAPRDPTILAGCARARVRLAFFGGEGSGKQVELAREAAARAIEGAPEVGEAWAALAAARFIGGDAPGAARALGAAIARAPGLAHAQELLGRIQLEVGMMDQAASRLRTALSIDPSTLSPRWELSRWHGLRREWDAAHALLDLPAPTPGGRVSKWLYRLRIATWTGQVHPELDEPPPMGPEFGALAHTHGVVEVIRSREISDAYRRVLEAAPATAEAGSRRRALFFQLSAELFAYVFEVDQALEYIQAAIRSGLLDLVWMDMCPVLEPVRRDARFAALRAEVDARAQAVVAALSEVL
jgi:serine/threonine-protein kinase